LLEELGAEYELRVLNLKSGEQREAAYLQINPMGKVPAILHGDMLVTEQVALYIYLADLFPEAGLAPALRDRMRGPYLRWLAYYGSCFEPAIIDFSMKRPPVPSSRCPYGDFNTMLQTVFKQLGKGPYLLGEHFSAADVLWGTSLSWMTGFKLVPEYPEVMTYISRINHRPSVEKVKSMDAKLFAAQVAAVEAGA
jgi:glutathione S-transferase